jgi:hypothetical protein
MSATPAVNLLLSEIEYFVEETPFGTWRRYVYTDGTRFAEFTSHCRWADLPLMHYTYGRCPETGKRVTARGVLAVGRFARGIVAVGQITIGLVAVGQLAIGLLFGLGMAATGAISVGQIAVSMLLGVGQLAVGHVAIGQIALGHYVMAQLGWGDFVWDSRLIDPQAHRFFLSLIGQ